MGNRGSRAAKEKYDSTSVIPEEIIEVEILTRLPVKSLVRFRCVCKSWKYMLSCDPDFVKSHLTRSSMDPNNSALIARCISYRGLCNRIFGLKFNKYQFHPLNSEDLKLCGSINGLVCVYHSNYHINSITCVGIWNPATHNYKDIPPPVKAHDFSFGFGFDPVTNDYKVIYVTITRNCPLVAHVYSCNAGSWGSKSVTSTFLSRGDHFKMPTIVHGRPYWYNRYVKCVEHYYVTYFDIRNEVFKLLPGVDFVDELKHRMVMVNLKDSLAVMLYHYPQTTSRLVDVHIFDEKCGLWCKTYTVGPITIPKYMGSLYCFKNGDLFFHGRRYIKLVSIDPETNAINRFRSGMFVYDYSRFQLCCSYAYGYIESLVSVKGMSQMYDKKVRYDVSIIERSF